MTIPNGHPATRFALAAAAAATILAAGAVRADWEKISDPLPGDPMGVHMYRLKNGLEVYLSENHDTPRFFAEMAVRTGSKYDPVDSTGLAHYMEHLLFKGTQRLGTIDYSQEKPWLDKINALYEERHHAADPKKRDELYLQINQASEEAAKFAIPNELDRIYKSMGARMFNAHTWHEEVVYQVELPANRLRPWAFIESDRFEHPVFRLFQTELETVYEEMNRALDNKDRALQLAVDAKLYKIHPYGQKPTLGSVEDLKNPSLMNLHKFCETWYAPNNFAVFISGDINADEAIAVIDQYFSGWQPRELPKRPTWDDPAPTAREEVRIQFQAEEMVLLAFRTASRLSPDAEALTMVDMLLDNATAGLINLNLNQQQRVTRAGAYPMQMNDYGAQYLYGIPKPGQSKEEVEKLLIGQIEHIKHGEFDDWLIQAIVNDFKRMEKTGLESDDSRVDRMRSAWIAFEPWEHAINRIKRMEAVTRDDVIRVANQYFGAGYIAGYREDAKREVRHVEKPILPKITIDPTRQSAFAREALDIPCPPMEPVYIAAGRDYEKKEDGRGITFFVNRNPINDVFTFSLRAAAGTRESELAAIAVRMVQISGTERLSPDDLQREWYKLGTTFNAVATDHETVFELSGLDENFEKSVALLMELLWKPTVAPEALEQLKAIILQQRIDSRKEQDTITKALVERHRYGNDAYYLRMPSTERVNALTAAELQQVIRGMVSARQIVCYTGTLDAAKVRDIVRNDHPVHGLLDDPPPYKQLNVAAPAASEVFFIQKEAAQAHVQLDFGGAPYDPRISPQVQLYNSYFADGMAGIVFQELREARALAYVAAARYTPGYRKGDQNVMMGVIQTQADKTVDAVGAFVGLLDRMPRAEERYATARESLLNSYRTGKIGFREVLETVLGWERRGINEDPRPSWFDAIIKAESIDTVMAFQKEAIADKPKLISIVGDKKRINLEALKAFGTVTELGLDEVFAK